MPEPPHRRSARRRLLRGAGRLVLALVAVAALRGLTVAWLPADETERAAASLRFLSEGLEAHADAMQRLFPEGRVFTLALTGLAWAELGRQGGFYPGAPPVEARRALALATDPASQATFGPAGGLPHGMFYEAWTARLTAAVIETPTIGADDLPGLRRGLGASCGRLAGAFEAEVFPDSYPGQAWPADAAVGAAALAGCGRLVDPAYGTAARAWLAAAQQREDPATGLLPHAAHRPEARGSSAALMIPFVAEIDAAYADTLYQRFDAAFSTRMLGVLPTVREYPHGTSGRGDVDSGPVVLGASAPASVVGIAAARSVGAHDHTAALSASTEWLGVPVSWRGRRRYAAGQLPVGDAFLAWARTRPVPQNAVPHAPGRPWRARWTLAFTVLLAASALGIVRSVRRR